MARPTDFSKEIVDKANEYLELCQDEEIQQLTGLSVKGTELYKNKLKVKIPTIEGLSAFLGIATSTSYEWEKKYPEFSEVIDLLRQKQAEALINNGLSGDYNPTIAKVLLTKHGYADKQELTGKDGEKLGLGVVVLPKKDEGTLATPTETGTSS